MAQIKDFVAEGQYSAIIYEIIPPMEDPYVEGWAAHNDGKQFHEYPYDRWSPEALSWRIGWNDRALSEQS